MHQLPEQEDEFEEFRSRAFSGGISAPKFSGHKLSLKRERSNSLHADVEYLTDRKGTHHKRKSEPHVRFAVRPGINRMAESSRSLSPPELSERPRLYSMPAQYYTLETPSTRLRSYTIGSHGKLEKSVVYVRQPSPFIGPVCLKGRTLDTVPDTAETEGIEEETPVKNTKEPPRASARSKKDEENSVQSYNIGMVGTVGVGKDTLLQAFYIAALSSPSSG